MHYLDILNHLPVYLLYPQPHWYRQDLGSFFNFDCWIFFSVSSKIDNVALTHLVCQPHQLGIRHVKQLYHGCQPILGTYICQVSQICWKSPDLGNDLPLTILMCFLLVYTWATIIFLFMLLFQNQNCSLFMLPYWNSLGASNLIKCWTLNSFCF